MVEASLRYNRLKGALSVPVCAYINAVMQTPCKLNIPQVTSMLIINSPVWAKDESLKYCRLQVLELLFNSSQELRNVVNGAVASKEVNIDHAGGIGAPTYS